MGKKVLRVLVFMFCFMVFQGIANAGGFMTLASTGMIQLSDDEAWSKSYNTKDGKFKIQFRKLSQEGIHRKYHLIIWWNDDRIADGYCPQSSTGYGFKIFKDTTTDRVFVSLETKPRLVLMGYDPKNKKLEKYVDSKTYASQMPFPAIGTDMDGDLKLIFIGDDFNVEPVRYKLTWDKAANWFSYKDITVRRPKMEVDSGYEPDEYDNGNGNNSGTVEVSSAAAYDTYQEEELYYEEVVVVGS